jgi:hypothetical protein
MSGGFQARLMPLVGGEMAPHKQLKSQWPCPRGDTSPAILGDNSAKKAIKRQ